MYEKLQRYLDRKGLKIKAEANAEKVEAIEAEYKEKEKTKPLTTDERLDRVEKLLGLQ